MLSVAILSHHGLTQARRVSTLPPFAVFGLVLASSCVALYHTHMASSTYTREYDGIVKAMQQYIDGSKAGNSELMRPAFHS